MARMTTGTTTENPSIYFEDIGDGLPIVLGHSFLCNGAMWAGQVNGLADRYRLINLDFRGHGRSGPADRLFTLHDAVDDVIGVLDQLGIEKAVWCGLSIGGMVALRAAVSRPDRVDKLIIMDSDAGAERLGRRIRYRLMGFAAQRVGTGPFLNEISRLMFGASTRRDKPELVEEWRGIFARVDIPSTIMCLNSLINRDSMLELLQAVDIPSLIMVGDEDVSLPPVVSMKIHNVLPNSKYVEIPKAGHLSALEQPEFVNKAIAGFLG